MFGLYFIGIAPRGRMAEAPSITWSEHEGLGRKERAHGRSRRTTGQERAETARRQQDEGRAGAQIKRTRQRKSAAGGSRAEGRIEDERSSEWRGEATMRCDSCSTTTRMLRRPIRLPESRPPGAWHARRRHVAFPPVREPTPAGAFFPPTREPASAGPIFLIAPHVQAYFGMGGRSERLRANWG